jgi:hypothetical protein
MQSFSAMRQALVSLALRGPKAAPKKSGGGKAKDSGALKKKKVVKKAVVKESSKIAHARIKSSNLNASHNACSCCGS